MHIYSQQPCVNSNIVFRIDIFIFINIISQGNSIISIKSLLSPSLISPSFSINHSQDALLPARSPDPLRAAGGERQQLAPRLHGQQQADGAQRRGQLGGGILQSEH